MGKSRIVLQNWIVELGFDPNENNPAGDFNDQDNSNPVVERIRQEVAKALKQLPEEERELVERIHFMGQSYRELAELSGRAEHRMESAHRRALKRLRTLLAPLVAELFGLQTSVSTVCPLCLSGRRAEIDRLIARKAESDTWSRTMALLRDQFGIPVKSPQLIIGHLKYH